MRHCWRCSLAGAGSRKQSPPAKGSVSWKQASLSKLICVQPRRTCRAQMPRIPRSGSAKDKAVLRKGVRFPAVGSNLAGTRSELPKQRAKADVT